VKSFSADETNKQTNNKENKFGAPWMAIPKGW